MIYIVSGYRRSGTSMMMRALHNGMKDGVVIFSPDFEDFNPDIDGWKANPNGLWEVGVQNYLRADFLRGLPDNGLIKIMFDGLPNLPVGDYTIIFMTRDPDEIRQSIETVERKLDLYATDSGLVRNKSEDPIPMLPFSCFRDYNQADIDHVRGICEARKDMDLIEVKYADVIKNPEWEFERIRHTPLGRTRLDLDVQKCVDVIEPGLYRTRNEVREREVRGVLSG